MKAAKASAPGKILWLGGYSVLEKNRVAYVGAVERRCTVSVEPLAGRGVEIAAPQLSAKAAFEFSGGKLTADNTSQTALAATRFASRAVEACLNYLEFKGHEVGGMRITTHSDPAFASGMGKSGLGASAAITVAAVAAVLQASECKSSEQLIHNASQYAHCMAQGKAGSGFDVAASTFGSCAYSRYSPLIIEKISSSKDYGKFEEKWDCKIEKVPLPQALVPAFANIIGESASTTAMVGKVNEWKKRNADAYAEIISRLDVANSAAISSLEKMRRGTELELSAFKAHFEEARALTRQLGENAGAPVEPHALRKLVDESLLNGAFCARLPGAGGGDAVAALCKSKDELQRLNVFWESYVPKKIAPMLVYEARGGVVFPPE